MLLNARNLPQTQKKEGNERVYRRLKYGTLSINGVSQDTGGVIYGTDNGTIGHLGTSEPGAKCLRKTWEIPGSGFGLQGGGAGRGVTALKRFDLTQDGVDEIIAGRDDGTVTVRMLYSGSK